MANRNSSIIANIIIFKNNFSASIYSIMEKYSKSYYRRIDDNSILFTLLLRILKLKPE